MYVYILFQILFHYKLLHDTEYSSLCNTVGPCGLSILYSSVYILIPNYWFPSSPTFPVLYGNHKFVFYICESISVL